MRLKLKKIESLDDIEMEQTVLCNGAYPATVECIDGFNENMKVFIKCIYSNEEFKYNFDVVQNLINKNYLFQIVGE